MVRVNNFLHRLEVLALIVVFLVLGLISFRPVEAEVAELVVKEVIAEVVEAVEVKIESREMALDDGYYMMLHNVYPWEQCDLSFYSVRHKKNVEPPLRFRETLYKYRDCNDQKILSRIAHYESDFNPSSINLSNTYAQGLYHVLPTTRNECSMKYGITEESDCALFVMKKFPSWYLAGYRDYGYGVSFQGLI